MKRFLWLMVIFTLVLAIVALITTIFGLTLDKSLKGALIFLCICGFAISALGVLYTH